MSDEHDSNEKKPATTDKGILANDHDVDKLDQDVAKLLQGLMQRGVIIDINRIDPNNIKARVEAVAACRMLVAKGIVTEAEMAAACNTEFKMLLMVILQAVEEMPLAQKPKLEDRIVKPAGAGKLAIVRH